MSTCIRQAGPRRSLRLGSLLLLAVMLLATACGDAPAEPSAPSAPTDTTARDVSRGFVIVLPPATGLAEAERARVRMLVERVLDAELPPAARQQVVLLEPADMASLPDAIERALRRVGDGGAVCVLGSDMREVLAPLLALYPATLACLLPAPQVEGDPHATADVDLEQLGRELGMAARAAAGSGTVLLLTGGDAMLDRRWRSGVVATAVAPVGMSAISGSVHTVRTADEVIALLDDQDALVAQGIEPGSPEAIALAEATDLGVADPDDLPAAFALPRVGVVVLDASAESVLLVEVLAERGVRVIAPRSILSAAGSPDDAVVLRWRVRWDVPLTELVGRLTGSGATAPVGEESIVLEPGPAYVAP